MISLTKLKKPSNYLIVISGYVIMLAVVLVVAESMMVNIMQDITGLLGQIQNSDSIQIIAISSAHLAIITLAVIWLIIVSILSLSWAYHVLSGWRGLINQSDTQQKI